jgi:superfamily I DNA and/or RNA helicase
MARGRQVIVVGDPEQLPPTNVGQRGDTEDDDGATVQSQQSILDECVACNLPRVRLSWHYRSRHESLIAFSNARYYRSELVKANKHNLVWIARLSVERSLSDMSVERGVVDF